jgi:hypothetical protein
VYIYIYIYVCMYSVIYIQAGEEIMLYMLPHVARDGTEEYACRRRRTYVGDCELIDAIQSRSSLLRT